MKRSLVVIALLLVAIASLAGSAMANHIGCQSRFGSHTSGTWKWTDSPNSGYNYTDWSDWSVGTTFTARRVDSGGATTFNQNSSTYLIFDNGTFSPWRKTGMYLSGPTQTTYFEQGNDNGSCS